MKSQFMHVELYSREEPAKKTINKSKNLNHQSDVRTTTVSGVLSEMKREEGFTSHLETIHAPNVLYGSIDALERSIERYEAEYKTTDKNGKEKKLRKDACILMAGVVSLDRADEEIWPEYKAKAIEYLKNKYGENLKCVVEHTDETNPHFHFYVTGNQKQDLNLLHDGKLAVSKLAKEDRKKLHNTAYTEAMIKFQDDFYTQVSNKFGLSRTGEEPRERFKSRPEYLRFKNRQQKALDILSDIEQFEASIKRKAAKKGFNKGIDDFNNKKGFFGWLNKMDWRLKKQDKKIESLEKEKNKIKLESEMKDEKLTIAYQERNSASKKNGSYINEINRLKKENAKLLPYKENFDKQLELEKTPLLNEIKELKTDISMRDIDNAVLKKVNSAAENENRIMREFIDDIKNYYGENFKQWFEKIRPQTPKPKL
ncbi:plasmid recombination protein [Enterobacter hormaechei]|uniref:plasmid recombination protein n=2 Tax=Enterobacteriaceae TaxID=543 RepID=UPI002093C76A|nr:plasmid recombination protein [Enterobacter hormaechei]MCO6024025.1 plasmid recombination protein [Enterobacter hormaechei]